MFSHQGSAEHRELQQVRIGLGRKLGPSSKPLACWVHASAFWLRQAERMARRCGLHGLSGQPYDPGGSRQIEHARQR